MKENLNVTSLKNKITCLLAVRLTSMFGQSGEISETTSTLRKTLSAWIKQELGISLGVRQCQRLFRHLGFRLRKPRPLLAKADPDKQAAYKKNLETAAEPEGGPVGHG